MTLKIRFNCLSIGPLAEFLGILLIYEVHKSKEFLEQLDIKFVKMASTSHFGQIKIRNTLQVCITNENDANENSAASNS